VLCGRHNWRLRRGWQRSVSQTVTVAVASRSQRFASGDDHRPPEREHGLGHSYVSVSAIDQVGISWLSFRLDGSMISTGSKSSLSYKWNTKRMPNGPQSISATATDDSGNQATSSIQVTR
jgi:hypothetical protein